MNQYLQRYARDFILRGLAKLPDEWQDKFRRMYGPQGDDGPERMPQIKPIVDQIPAEKLSWAMDQVANSVQKINARKNGGAGDLEPDHPARDTFFVVESRGVIGVAIAHYLGIGADGAIGIAYDDNSAMRFSRRQDGYAFLEFALRHAKPLLTSGRKWHVVQHFVDRCDSGGAT